MKAVGVAFTPMANEYLHGFDKKEQSRLIHQADFLEPYVYSGIDLEFCKNLLEVGCGVGAQTKILCRRFPKLKIDSVDFSKDQLLAAKYNLQSELKSKKVRLFQQDAQKLKMKNKDYDAAFLCWFLEHVPSPLQALKRVHQHLKKDGTVYISEVFNQTLFVEPYSPAYMKYWFEFNDYQWSIKGHPFVGASLGHLLDEAGFRDIRVEPRSFHFDSREPEKRAAFTQYFTDILLSAEKTLVESGRVSKYLVQEMKHEMKVIQKAKNAVFFYAFMRAVAKK